MLHRVCHLEGPQPPCLTDVDRTANIALTVNEMKGPAAVAALSR
jgi:hypothetical protein